MTSQDVLYWTLTVLSITAFGLLSYLIIRSYGKIEEYEEKILKKQDEIDTLEERIQKRHGTIMQARFDKIVIHEKEPLLKELNILKMKRQFILDKIPLITFFKK